MAAFGVSIWRPCMSRSFSQTRHTTDPGESVAEANRSNRSGFLRKVYGILTAQLALTTLVATICKLTPAVRSFFVGLASSGSQWFRFAVLIPTAASLFCLRVAKHSYPANHICLLVFTICISVNVGFVCSVLYAYGLGELVLQAFAITFVLVLALTAFSLCSGVNFSFMACYLKAALLGLVMTGFIGVVFPSLVENLVMSFLGALVFSGFIVYDTYRLAKKFDYDDYIAASIELYLDVVNLFLYILKILIKISAKGKKKK